ncbi:MAG: 50S ribosomal protein L15 [candidate division WOR-3 bacterium]|nr:50S ribosomal protein L15 [candidate division WOR-3 bacterium]MCX7947459.1 50S ribosomal protein L15 [candidate division WOR-3 bacterium]MDW8150618.1 50S ribosomal protein L15 [candidate division WOR-3 bacterium]
MITLSNLKPKRGANTKKTRVGRGIGSGLGKTAGRGQKGQKSREGDPKEPWFEGGQTPIYRRLPKRGFNNPFSIRYQEVNLNRINEKFNDGEVVNKQTLYERKLIRSLRKPVKILAKGNLSKKLVFEGIDKFSKKAIELINLSGSEIKV